MYVVDPQGERIHCPHPLEFYTIEEVTGLGFNEAVDKGLCGYLSDFICCECLEQFSLDIKRDILHCPSCTSAETISVNEIVGKKCPKCGDGTIVAEDTGIMT